MPTPDFRFAKTLATPTETAWTHVYHAGSVFTVLSLAKDILKEDETISAIGKEFLNTLEAEFFGLPEKTLPSMKEALTNSVKELPEDVRISLCLAYCKEGALYVFGIGGATAFLKRNEQIGTILKETGEEKLTRSIHAASGFVKADDTILLTTETFAKRISLAQITQACEEKTPEAISDSLSRMLENVSDGDAGVLILTYRPPETDALDTYGQEPPPETPTEAAQTPTHYERDESQVEETAAQEDETTPPSHTYEHLREAPTVAKQSTLSALKGKLAGQTSRLRSLPKAKLPIFVVAVIILLILIGGIYTTTKKREESKTSALFTKVYADAKSNYDLGMSLKDLTKPLAQDDFQKAKKTITDNKAKFKADSQEANQLADLEKKVDAELSGTASVHTVDASPVDNSADDILAAEKAQSGAIAATKDDTTIYTMTKSEVFKGSSSIITGGSDWSAPVGVAAYNGNVYILDQKNGVLKYAAGSNSYGKSSYFKDSSPSMEKTQAIAIDSDVWILLSDSIQKYTKGSQDPFGVLGIDKPFNNPTKIVTSADMANLYVLDKGNSRIVKIKKDGTFLAQYAASVLGNAKDFDVDEKANTAYILSGDKIYKISLQ